MVSRDSRISPSIGTIATLSRVRLSSPGSVDEVAIAKIAKSTTIAMTTRQPLNAPRKKRPARDFLRGGGSGMTLAGGAAGGGVGACSSGGGGGIESYSDIQLI